MCSWACIAYSKEPFLHEIMFKSPRDCCWLLCFCTHLIYRLVGRELCEIFILRWCSATVLYFVWLFFFCSTVPNLEENPSFMKHEVVKSCCYGVVVFLTSVIFLCRSWRCSLCLLSQMAVELFWVLPHCILYLKPYAYMRGGGKKKTLEISSIKLMCQKNGFFFS